MASGYFILENGDMGLSQRSGVEDTYSSPLRIISQIASTCPCLQTARKMPATAKSANIFFLASGPAFRQHSTHVLTHCASSSISVTFSHATFSPSRSASGSVSMIGSVASVASWTGFTGRGANGSLSGCTCTLDNELMGKQYLTSTFLFTSSLNMSTSSEEIHRFELVTRLSVRTDPERNVLSTSLRELLPSIAARKLNLSDGSPAILYRHGAQTFSCSQASLRPRASCCLFRM